jgi:1-acyl-sn-glycerol-3-phosphate acyltransferase
VIISFFKGSVGVFILALSLFVCNLCQALSLVFYPIQREWVYRLNRIFAFSWWALCSFVVRYLCGVRFIISGDALPMSENVLFISNHQCMADIIAILIVGERQSRLADLKWFAKEQLKWLPGIGWGLMFVDSLLIKRNWTTDRSFITKMFERYRERNIPFWVISFLEGTRATEKKLMVSQEFARRKKLPATEYVLIPRVKGFYATVQGLDGLFTAVYDLTIGYAGSPPGLWEFFLKPMPPVHLHLRRFPASALPREEMALTQWTYQLYREKDALLKLFHQSGHF